MITATIEEAFWVAFVVCGVNRHYGPEVALFFMYQMLRPMTPAALSQHGRAAG